METNNAKGNSESQDLESLNELSEQAIREDYLKAALHGPRWVLALLDETN